MLFAVLHFVLHPTPGSAVGWGGWGGERSWLVPCSRGCSGFVSKKKNLAAFELLRKWMFGQKAWAFARWPQTGRQRRLR